VKVAFEISEQFDIPVMIRLTTRIAHSKENVGIGERKEVPKKDFKIDTQKYVMVPKNAYLRHIDLEKRLEKLKNYSEKTKINKLEINDKKLGFITSGITYLYAKEMFPEASFLKLGMSHPFPDKKVIEFSKKVKNIFVIEELEPFIEEQVKALGIKIKTKHPSFRVGELLPEHIVKIVAGKKKEEKVISSRKPSMCPGCPHSGVFSVLKKLGVTVSGDIGCYTLAAAPPFSALHTCLCMGGGVTFFEGLTRALGKNVVGVIGDSTFVHSGITGLINAAYNGVKGVIIILDNSTTAMTGGQPHPATGFNIKGQETKQLLLENICEASGADTVDIIDPFAVKELEELIKKRISDEKLSVIIARRPCKLMVDKNKKS